MFHWLWPAELEDFLMKSLADRTIKKKMSATNAKALNTMKQRVKKHNAGYQKDIEAFRENPVSSSEEEPEGVLHHLSSSSCSTLSLSQHRASKVDPCLFMYSVPACSRHCLSSLILHMTRFH